MKFPSIFRVSQPQRFNIVPRHYDPVKEEIEMRTSQIRKDLEKDGVLPSEDAEEALRLGRGSSIRGAFTKGSPIKQKPSSIFESTGVIRLIIIVLLIGGFGGYIYIGPDIIYYFIYLGLGIGSLVVLFKLKGKSAQ
ncbi:MAG TPA: hypothetical protein VK957_07960 [Lunatimonas sp.]|nr:hypothetical protein [Lunatimonas sp.]